jgi:Xaa-Pro aminopeptidase
MDHQLRFRNLIPELERRTLDALLVTHLPNIRYLCGFTGSAGVLLAGPRPVFFTDGRYTAQAREEVHGARVVTAKGPVLIAVAEMMQARKLGRVGIEAEHMTLAIRAALRRLTAGIRLIESREAVEQARMIKDAGEIALIRKAVLMGSSLLNPMLKTIRPGVRETEIAGKLEFAARRAGAEKMSFETIVASGARSALPHGVASQHAVAARGFVVLDYGVILAGYCSDMTRTVHVGRAGERERACYQAVLEAQLAAIEAVKPGVTAGEVDEAARSTLKRARLAKYFTHSTGHGVGLEIHESPRIAARQQQVLHPGMVITIEPGVYIPGRYGVRIEDMVLVTGRGHETLTPSPKELIEI